MLFRSFIFSENFENVKIILEKLAEYDSVIEKIAYLKLYKLSLEVCVLVASKDVKRIVEKYQEFNSLHVMFYKQSITQIKFSLDEMLIKKGLKSIVQIINI